MKSAQPVLPDHDHGRGVELAVAEELAADVLPDFRVAGPEAVADVLVGAHGSRAVLDYIQFLEFGELCDGRRVAVQQGEGREGVVGVDGRVPVAVFGVFGEEPADGGVGPSDRQDDLDRVAALHAGVVVMATREVAQVQGAFAGHGLLAGAVSPGPVRPSDQAGACIVAPQGVNELTGDGDLVAAPVVDRAFVAEQRAQRLQEAHRRVVGFGIQPLGVPEGASGLVDDVAAPLEGHMTVGSGAGGGG